MDRPRALRRFALGTLLWVAAAALMPAHFALTICRFAGLVHFDAGGSCCAGAAPAEVPAQANLDDQRCCSLRAVHVETVPVERHTAARAPALTPTRTFLLEAPRPTLVAQARPRPGDLFAVGPPLILVKRSFLL